jgi:type III secretion system FlhB-like substrate exporter
MATKAITIHLSEKAIKELEEVAQRRKLNIDEMLVRLIEESLRLEIGEEAPGKSYTNVAELTTAYLSGKLERRGSINNICFDPEVMGKAAMETFGTMDISQIIKMVRR